MAVRTSATPACAYTSRERTPGAPSSWGPAAKTAAERTRTGRLIGTLLEVDPDTDLHLARIGGGSRLPESGPRLRAGTERVVGKLVIGAVQHVEGLDERFHGTRADGKPAAQPQVERGERERAAAVAADTRGTVVHVGVVVAIGAGEDVERQRRTV